MMQFYELIYTSVLADTVPPSCVADIVRAARNFNGAHDITGVLIFDGAHFCHYLEGEQATILALISRIETDARHVNFIIRHQGSFESQRRFAGWPMAYALDDGGAILEKFLSTDGPDTATLLLQTMPLLDTDIFTKPG